MDIFNIIAGMASILGLLFALFFVNKYIKNARKTNISQTSIGSKNNQKINYRGK